MLIYFFRGSDDDDYDDKPRRSPKSNKSNDEEKELLPRNDDSGNSSDDSQHSYTYQYEKKPSEIHEREWSKTSFKDVEKQQKRDYASMEDFRNSSKPNKNSLE